MACSECGQNRGHMGGCSRGSGGGGSTPSRRSRAKGTPRGGKPGDVQIAAHTSNWVRQAVEKHGKDYHEVWVCTVCSRHQGTRSRSENHPPSNVQHPATIRK